MSYRRQHLLSADGTKIWAECAGNPSKPAVVFLHGLTSGLFVFDRQFSDENLLKDLYMIRYDLRGHGQSDCPATPTAYESRRYAEDFDAVCKWAGANKPVVLGW